MTFDDMVALLPLVVTAASAVLVMLAIAARRHHGLTSALTLAGLGAALACLPAAWAMAPRQVTALLVIDRYALFYIGLALSAAVAVALLSYDYLARRAGRKEEFYLLLLLATAGAGVLAASSHFASFFLGLELLTVSLYALIAFRRERAECIEAGVKYLVLAGASSAILLFGMALVYADLGTMRFDEIAARAGAGPHSLLLMTGTGLLLVGIGFKLAVVPFHLWTPDVYEGAPAPVTAYVATVSKGAVFALLLRYVSLLYLNAWGVLPAALAVLAAASMFAGNLLALRQDNVKRILAYSSIAHMGYLLVALLAGARGHRFGTCAAAEAVTFYLVAYYVTTLGAFGVVAALSGPDRDAGSLAEFRGLLWRRPALGVVLIAMVLSLAGIPLTAGFVGKFLVVAAGVSSALWALIAILVVNSAIGLYYYLRIVVAVCRPPAEAWHPSEGIVPVPAGLALAALTVLLIWLGAWPGPMIDVIRGLFVNGNW